MSFQGTNPSFPTQKLAAFSVVGAFVIVALGATGSWGYHALCARQALKQAQAQQGKGFNVLAVETLESVRTWLVGSASNCEALINVYYGAKRAERLEWAAQACMDSGNENNAVDLGLAGSMELSGRYADALRVLQQITQKYPGSPDAYYRMASIYQRAKDNAHAGDYLLSAAERSSNNTVIMEALEFLSQMQRWSDARRVGMMIRNAPTTNPEVKLMIARALIKGGDADGAQGVVAQAKDLLNQHADVKGKLEAAYADVLVSKQSAERAAPAASDGKSGHGVAAKGSG